MIRKLKYSLLLSVAVVGASAAGMVVEDKTNSLNHRSPSHGQEQYEKEKLLDKISYEIENRGNLSKSLSQDIVEFAPTQRSKDSAHVYFGGTINIKGQKFFVKVSDSVKEVEKLRSLKEQSFYENMKHDLQRYSVGIAMPEYMEVLQDNLLGNKVAITIAPYAGEMSVAELLSGGKKIDGVKTTRWLQEEAARLAGKALASLQKNGSHGDAHFNNIRVEANSSLLNLVRAEELRGAKPASAANRAIAQLKALNEDVFKVHFIDIETIQPKKNEIAYNPTYGDGKNEAHDLFKAFEAFYSNIKDTKFGEIKSSKIENLRDNFVSGYVSFFDKERLEQIQYKLKAEGRSAKLARMFDQAGGSNSGEKIFDMLSNVNEADAAVEKVRTILTASIEKELNGRNKEQTALPKEKTKEEIKQEFLADMTTEFVLEDLKDGSEFGVIKEKKVLSNKALIERRNRFQDDSITKSSLRGTRGHAPEKKEFNPLLQSIRISRDKGPLSPREIQERKDKLLKGVETKFEESKDSDGFTVVRVKPTLNLKETLKKIESVKGTLSETSTQADDEEWQVLDFDESKENLFVSKIKMDASKLETSRVNRFERAEEPVRSHAPEKTPTEPSRSFFGKVLGFFGR